MTSPDISRAALERLAATRRNFNFGSAADLVLALRDALDAAERERDELIDENSDLKNAPWPEWAERMKHAIREETGYDGYDDVSNGIDLPKELDEMISELREKRKAAERERDNWKAHAISRGKRLRKTRDKFINIKDELCDDGDRVYFGSTNHADMFKDDVEWLDAFAWNKIMGEPEDWDLLGALDKFRSALDAERKKVAEEAEKLRLAREHIELKCRERDAAREENARLREAAQNLLRDVDRGWTLGPPMDALRAALTPADPSDLAEKDYGTPIFDAVWEAIKRWDLDRGDYPGAANRRSSYAGATGTDVQAILNVVNPFVTAARAAGRREGLRDAIAELRQVREDFSGDGGCYRNGVTDAIDAILALADQEPKP